MKDQRNETSHLLVWCFGLRGRRRVTYSLLLLPTFSEKFLFKSRNMMEEEQTKGKIKTKSEKEK